MNICLLSAASIFLSVLNLTHTARVLGVFTSPIKSHLLIHAAVGETLAAAGHNVTVIGSFPNLLPQAKYHYIHIPGIHLEPEFFQQSVDSAETGHTKFYRLIGEAVKSANNCMQHSIMQDFLTSHKAGDFDVVILGYYNNEFMLGLGAHFQCPIVVSFMLRPIFCINYLTGNPQLPAYEPNILAGFTAPMGFSARLKNRLYNIIEDYIMRPLINMKNREMYK